MAKQTDILAYAPVRRRRWPNTKVTAILAAILLSAWGGRQAWVYYYRPWERYGSYAAWEHHLCAIYRRPPSYVVTELKPTYWYGWDFDRLEPPSSQRDADWKPQSPYPRDLLFSHERTSHGKKARLVMLYLRSQLSGTDKRLVFKASSYSIQLQGSPDPYDSKYTDPAFYIPLTPGPNTYKVYFGQPDPDDDSHFMIKYEINDRPGTIDGWLQPDDIVKLHIRDGPATKPELKR